MPYRRFRAQCSRCEAGRIRSCCRSSATRDSGTAHGDWWSLRGWWIYVGTAAVALLSKYVLKWRGAHVFNPSNIGLVICFVALGRNRAAPLDFWWGPTSAWLAAVLAIIVIGGFAILWRLKLLRVALSFWIA